MEGEGKKAKGVLVEQKDLEYEIPAGLNEEQANQFKSDIKIIDKLEEYCSSAEFTEAIASYMEEYEGKFNLEFTEATGYPIQYHEYYTVYIKLLDNLLEKFVESCEHTSEEIYYACLRLKEISAGYLSCLDYILATVEFTDFVSIMIQSGEVEQWNLADDPDVQFQELMNLDWKNRNTVEKGENEIEEDLEMIEEEKKETS